MKDCRNEYTLDLIQQMYNILVLSIRGLHGSKNSYPNPKRPVNMPHGTDADPTIIRKLDPNPAGKRQTRLHPVTETDD